MLLFQSMILCNTYLYEHNNSCFSSLNMKELLKFLWLVKDHHQPPTAVCNSMGKQFHDSTLCDLTILLGKIQVNSWGILVPNLLLITFLICTTAITFHAGKFASNLHHSPKYLKMELNILAYK
jgi:hypothetical protein